jgi:D-glycero-D-manno-heptose 1,7-bisphosphate phosphatase
MAMSRKAVFLDKDGTLIENVPYNVDPAEVRLAPGAGEALRMLSDAGFQLVVVSNQSGVARGYFHERDLACIELRTRDLLREEGVSLAGWYYCPHHPDGKVSAYRRACDCRKPGPGLITRAAEELDIDLEQSWLIGDILDDVEAGNRAGVRTILMLNGGETKWVLSEHRRPDQMVRNLRAAANYILAQGAQSNRGAVA